MKSDEGADEKLQLYVHIIMSHGDINSTDSASSLVRNKRWPVDCPIAGCKGQKGARGAPGPLGPQVCL